MIDKYNYTVAFITKEVVTDLSKDTMVDSKGVLWSVWTAPTFCCRVGVHTKQQADLVREKAGGIPVPIRKEDKLWKTFLKKYRQSMSNKRDSRGLTAGVLTSVTMYPSKLTTAKIICSLKPISEPSWPKPPRSVLLQSKLSIGMKLFQKLKPRNF